MGAAIGLFNGSICVQVDRMRFLPVKTTNDLFHLCVPIGFHLYGHV